VSYQQDTVAGESLPLRIDYTENSAAGLQAYNSVRFEYEQLSTPVIRYVAGSVFSSRKRLSRIKLFTGEAMAWQYRAYYETESVTREDRIWIIDECNSQGTCVPGTRVFWGADPSGPQFSAAGNLYDNNINPPWAVYTSPTITGDWNGDGKTDSGSFGLSNTGIVTNLYYSNGDGTFTHPAPTNVVAPFDFSKITSGADPTTVMFFTGDWNGDGLTDVGCAGNENVLFYTSTGNGFTPFTELKNNNYTPEGVTYRNVNENPIILGDWNGDGRTDFARVAQYEIFFWVSTGSGYQSLTHLLDLTPIVNFWSARNFPLQVGDFNGDGLTDIARVGFYGVRAYLSTGTSFVLMTNFPQWGYLQGTELDSVNPFISGDWNGDGLTDLGRVMQNATQLCYSNGVSFGNCIEIADFSPGQGFSNDNSYPIFASDFNGDGTSDPRHEYRHVFLCIERHRRSTTCHDRRFGN
jgi:hypothetical protein